MQNEINQIELLVRQDPDAAASKAKKLFTQFLSSGNDKTTYQLAAKLLQEKQHYSARQLGDALLQKNPKDVKARHFVATVASRAGHYAIAVDHLINCLEINPDLAFIRFDLANALYMSGNYPLALKQVSSLKPDEANEKSVFGLQAACLQKLGEFENAAQLYKRLLDKDPGNEQVLLRYGTILKTLGQTDHAITIFKKALTANPSSGEAYWSLANLKTYTFPQSDIETMETLVNGDSVNSINDVLLRFSLGTALEAAQNYSLAFEHFDKANKFLRNAINYDVHSTSNMSERIIATFPKNSFAKKELVCDSAEPIFIVGLPRSGSTLIEQILSCHSKVDATMELSEIASMASSLNYSQFGDINRKDQENNKALGYPELVARLDPGELKTLAEEYLKRTKSYRKNGLYFVDKSPANFIHVGLIKSILPNAKIIDTRRNPLACGMSIYKQFFASGFQFANSLEDIGHYYNTYLKLMNHWHHVLPEEILTVQYENVVNNLEVSVREILDYCNLEFEQGCIDFHTSKRAVATVSAEQVRQPIYNKALEHWKNYEDNLAPLKNILAHNDSAKHSI